MSIGLKRDKFGDIMLADERIQFFCAEEISDYVKLELQSMGKASVELIQQPLSETILQKEQWIEMMITVSSVRIDTIISSIYKISRQKSQVLIHSGLVKVNWTVIESTSFECGEGDTISVRGYGRVKFFHLKENQKKKNGKWSLVDKNNVFNAGK